MYWWQCVICEFTWISDNPSPDREWCIFCDSPEVPELIYEETSV